MAGILIGCALKREREALQRNLGDNCRYLATGLGGGRTRATLAKYFATQRPSLFIFTGTAGQLDPSLARGEVILSESWCRKDGRSVSTDRELAARLRGLGWKISGRGLTVSIPVLRKKSRLKLYREYSARICDMESAVAMTVAAQFKIPCLAPKVVSDTAGSGWLFFWKHFDDNMRRLARYLEPLLACFDGTEAKAVPASRESEVR